MPAGLEPGRDDRVDPLASSATASSTEVAVPTRRMPRARALSTTSADGTPNTKLDTAGRASSTASHCSANEGRYSAGGSAGTGRRPRRRTGAAPRQPVEVAGPERGIGRVIRRGSQTLRLNGRLVAARIAAAVSAMRPASYP